MSLGFVMEIGIQENRYPDSVTTIISSLAASKAIEEIPGGLEGTDTDNSSKKLKKKSVDEVLDGKLVSEDGKQGTSADDYLALVRQFVKKVKVKGGKLFGDDDDMDNLFEGIPSLLDSYEDENTQLAGEASRKSDKSSSNERSREKRYNRKAQGEDQDQKEEQKAESSIYYTDVNATT
ncbi:hypothetical protein T459_16698 [Capsicum annuum]|uniref:Uncharacterized protein n=1 Tax=Capsicum annuum TaxID=4072 RepID=A0A2G2Z9H1_CAPAN|nr:hypothetical protein T459_16698 [Capsicum annuum]